jgi:formylglycine-generating enzyme required for sulfatase activity
MSAAVETYRDDVEATYAVDFSRDREPVKARSRFPEYRRRGGAPTRVSGMHCRRNKRWTWGSGRGARMLNTRAFAGAVAFAIASVATSVFGQGLPIAMRTINNVGNANSAAGMGGVPYLYQIGTNEVTNTQYAAFLNAVGRTNPNGIYNTNMGSNALGGITQAGTSGNFTYSVKPGFESRPTTFVNWWSAARFVNWLQNGQTTNASSLETGSYNLNNATTGAPVPRTAGAGFVLPSLNEWYKAAFHTGGLASTSYTTYGTNSNTQPTAAVTNTTLANRANFDPTVSQSTSAVAVGSYSNSASSYGLFDTMGNVIEMLDTPNPNNLAQFRAMGGAWNTTSANLLAQYSSSPTSIVGLGTTAASNSLGFRVAAVPEPSTYAMLGAGVAGLGGFRWLKRRQAAA